MLRAVIIFKSRITLRFAFLNQIFYNKLLFNCCISMQYLWEGNTLHCCFMPPAIVGASLGVLLFPTGV